MTEGYNGLGEKRSVSTALYQAGAGTIFGRSTTGVDKAVHKLTNRLGHVSSVYGKGSKIAGKIAGEINHYESMGVKIGLGFGGVGGAISNEIEK